MEGSGYNDKGNTHGVAGGGGKIVMTYKNVADDKSI